ncbi:MAG: protein kinase [Elusimicrobia bacterium]|nr:protein kinase [Elusimicrobiota bacterium]
MRKIEPGDIVDGYRIVRKIGEGGMGSVYKGFDEKLSREVAIKFMLEHLVNEKSLKRFLREGSAIAKCDHPSIVRVYSCGEYEGAPYLVMEYVDGEPLSRFMDRAKILKDLAGQTEDLKKFGYIGTEAEDKKIPYFLRELKSCPLKDKNYPALVCALVGSVARALAEAHSRGVLHRDIKPSNILLNREGAVKLLDFGLSKSFGDPELTAAHQILGTLRYIAPESFGPDKNPLTPAGDIYSLGVVFYELLTLEHPFAAEDTASFMARIISGKFKPASKLNPSIPAGISRVIAKCLAINPAQRYQSAALLAEDLRSEAESGKKSPGTPLLDGIKVLFKAVASHKENSAEDAEDMAGVADGEYAAADIKMIEIITKSGDVAVRGCAGPNVKFSALDAGNSSGSLKAAVSPGVLSIISRNRTGVSVSAPENIAVKITAGSGDVELKERTAAVEVTTGSGDVALENVSGRLKARMGTGDLDGTISSNEAVVLSGAGDVTLSVGTTDAAGSNIDIKTGSGDVTLDFPEGTELAATLRSPGGDIKNELGTSPHAAMKVRVLSGAGDITLRKQHTSR